jgi:rRNA maturation RNase YbeY
MLNLEINQPAKTRLPVAWFKRVAQAFAQAEKISGQKYFSLALVGSQTIKKLNRCYRGQNQVTDVLSFSEDRKSAKIFFDNNFLGEVIICVPQAKRQAQAFGWDLQTELARLLTHGLAHLAGYEHEAVSDACAQAMSRQEARVLAKVFKNKK